MPLSVHVCVSDYVPAPIHVPGCVFVTHIHGVQLWRPPEQRKLAHLPTVPFLSADPVSGNVSYWAYYLAVLFNIQTAVVRQQMTRRVGAFRVLSWLGSVPTKALLLRLRRV